jgi:hypothetical protein
MITQKENKRNLEWGILMITFGIAALVDTFTTGSDWLIVGGVALGGLIGLAVYLVDRSDWVLLIPPYILFVAAGISALALLGYADGDYFASFVLLMIGLPFLVVFLQDRKKWWALIPAYVMFVISLIIAIEEFGLIDDSWIATVILGSISLPFLVVFLRDRAQWWALIPFYILGAIAVMIPLIETHVIGDAWIATYVLSSVALPFLVVFFRDRAQWWALIPSYVLLSIGLMVGLIDARVLVDLVIPAYVMLSIAAPFFAVYFVNREQRWALIPGSIMGVMGMAFLVSTDLFQYAFPIGLILVGGWVLFKAMRK